MYVVIRGWPLEAEPVEPLRREKAKDDEARMTMFYYGVPGGGIYPASWNAMHPPFSSARYVMRSLLEWAELWRSGGEEVHYFLSFCFHIPPCLLSVSMKGWHAASVRYAKSLFTHERRRLWILRESGMCRSWLRRWCFSGASFWTGHAGPSRARQASKPPPQTRHNGIT